ncbi:PREDICTED: uncharacterized protein LOC106323493 [Brassica oleracea var. oleracea]|uniref:uncharacterized protein LOC106323493 n=1 Tax=Brassica oleracea var. oleracea TaxID=109376 RepID=UPI0006A75086|nr:PREDICTED: uncharacterized protein LOC106323493 [Brassica oleracea var. oleracea]
MDFMDSETQPPDDSPHLETSFNAPPPLAPECKSFKWKIQVIDSEGSVEGKMVTSKDVWKLQSSKVIVHFDENSSQPIGDSGGLLGSWLGQLSNDVNLLPINYSDWRMVNIHTKRKAWDVIQSKFWFDDPTMRKGYVMSALGSRCKDVKLRLWKEHKRNDQLQTLQNRPNNVPEEQWEHFVHMRFTEKWKKMQERNTKNQKKHTMPHVCGRKSFSRKRNDITIRTGKTPCRAEFFIETRTKPDGSFVCEEAKTRAEALTTLLNQNSHGTSNVAATLDDEFAQVFGPERPGRVRCVGRGPTPSKLVRRCTATRQEVDNSEMVVALQTQVKELSNQVKGMSTFIQQIIGTSTGEQARAWAASFAVAFANIPNPPFANIPTPSNPNQEPFAAEVWISPQADLHSVAAWINQPRINADAHATPVIKPYFQSAIYLLWKERNVRVFTAVSSPSSVILASLDRMMRDRLLSYPASSSFSSSLLLFIFLV